MADPILRVSDLWYTYPEQVEPVLRGIDLAIPQGQFLALVGANGSGKTTLAKHFNGLLKPQRGVVQVAGLETHRHSIGALARQVGFLFQNPEQQIFGATVRQEVAFGPTNLGWAPEVVQARTDASLARFGLSSLADRPPAILGYGIRRRVTLASLAAMDPAVLVLDEPTVGLDAPGLQETLDWLVELHAEGRTVVLVTHDMPLAAEQADRIVVLHQGRILGDGAPQEVFCQADLLAQASLFPPPVMELAQSLRPLGLADDCLTVEAFVQQYVRLIQQRGTPGSLPREGA